MANKIILKKSSVSSKVPLGTDLEYGELAINYADGKLYFKSSSNTIKSFTEDSNTVTLAGTQTLTNKTLSSAVLTGSLTAGGSTGSSGQVLTSTGSGVQWQTPSSSGITEQTVVTSDTNVNTIDTFSASTYRAADYHIVCSTNSGFNSLRISLIHDSTDVTITTYASVGTAQGTFTSAIVSGDVELYFTPDIADTEVKFLRTTINNSGSYSLMPTLPGDLQEETEDSIDLQSGGGSIDLMEGTISLPSDLSSGSETIDLQSSSEIIDLN